MQHDATYILLFKANRGKICVAVDRVGRFESAKYRALVFGLQSPRRIYLGTNLQINIHEPENLMSETVNDTAKTHKETKEWRSRKFKLFIGLSASIVAVLTVAWGIKIKKKANNYKESPLAIAETAMIKIKEGRGTIDIFSAKSLSGVVRGWRMMEKEVEKIQSLDMKMFVQMVKEHNIIEIFCNKCTQILKESETAQDLADSIEFYYMICMLVNWSNRLEAVNDDICKQTDFFKMIAKRLKQWHEHYSQRHDEKDDVLITYMLGIIHNLAMHHKYVTKMREINCIEVAKLYVNFEHEDIKMLSIASVAELANAEETILVQSDDHIKHLMKMITPRLQGKLFYGWSLAELTKVISEIAKIDDSSKKKLMETNIIPLLVQITESEIMSAKLEAIEALCTISLNKDIRKEILERKEWGVDELLKRLSTSSHKVIRRRCKDLSWLLTEGIHESSQNGPHIMISYNWTHQKEALKIKEILKENKLRVWMDVDDMYGSTLAAMAQGVEGADIVIMCYSYDYQKSTNCRAEAEYAFTRKKVIIPVKMEDYNPDGWLGIILGDKKYYKIDQKEDLLKEIFERRS